MSSIESGLRIRRFVVSSIIEILPLKKPDPDQRNRAKVRVFIFQWVTADSVARVRTG